MKKFTLLLSFFSLFLFRSPLFGQDIHWTLSNSPVHVGADMIIEQNQQLIIDPGVTVLFDGYYKITIKGKIKATGTAAQPITFKAADTAGFSDPYTDDGGWGGLTLLSSLSPGSTLANGADTFAYCNFRDIKTKANSTFITDRPTVFDHCDVFHNIHYPAQSGATGIFFFNPYASDGFIKIEHCRFHDNETFSSVLFLGSGKITLSDNTFEHNSGRYITEVFSNNQDSVSIRDNDFSNNELLLYEGGIPLLIYNSLHTRIAGNLFYNNACSGVGALKLGDSKGIIEANRALNNSVVMQPGMVLCLPIAGGIVNVTHAQADSARDQSETDVIIRNNVIDNNDVASTSALLTQNVNCSVWNNTLTNNLGQYASILCKTAGCTFMAGAGRIDFNNNILYHNRQQYNTDSLTQVDAGSGTQVHFDYNFMESPFGQTVLLDPSAMLTSDTGHNRVSAAPGLVSIPALPGSDHDALNADFGLTDSSVCLDKGLDVNAGPSDCSGNDRVVDTIDIGALEFQAGNGNTGIEPLLPVEEALVIWPNPAGSSVQISVPETGGEIRLYDIRGRLMLRVRCNQRTMRISGLHLPSGAYLVDWHNKAGRRGSAARLMIRN